MLPSALRPRLPPHMLTHAAPASTSSTCVPPPQTHSQSVCLTLTLPQRCKDTILNLEARVTELAGGVPPAKPSDVQRSLQQQQLQQQQQHRPPNYTAGVAVGTLGALNGASPRAAAPVGLVQVPAGYGPGWGAKA